MYKNSEQRFLWHMQVLARAKTNYVFAHHKQTTRTYHQKICKTHILGVEERHAHTNTHMLPTKHGHVTLAWHRIYRECNNVLPFRAPGILHHIWVLCYRHKIHFVCVCGMCPHWWRRMLFQKLPHAHTHTHSWNTSRVWPEWTTVRSKPGTALITILKRGWLTI